MPSLAQRGFLGFVAGALAVLVFHQGLAMLFHLTGLLAQAPFRLMLVPPLWVPAVVSLCFWGGLYGAAAALLQARAKLAPWTAALILAVVATLLRWLVFAPLEGHAIAFGFAAWPMGRSLLLQLAWALGFVALLPALTPRPLLRRAVG